MNDDSAGGLRGEMAPDQLGRREIYLRSSESRASGEIDFRDVLAGMRRQKDAIGWSTLVVVLLVVAWTLWVTPVWSAAALIRVEDKEQGLLTAPALTALTGLGGGGSELETELRILQTRPIAEDVVDRLDLTFVVTDPLDVPRDVLFTSLDFGRSTVEDEFEIRHMEGNRYRLNSTSDDTPALQRDFEPGEPVEIAGGTFVLADPDAGKDVEADPMPRVIRFETHSFQAAVKDLREDLSATRPDREANVLQVTYRSTDRILVYSVPNTAARIFIARRAATNRADASSTVAYIEAQVDSTRTQLKVVEDSLKRFQEKQQVVSVEAEAEAQIGRRSALETQRMQLDAEREALARLLTDVETDSVRPNYRRLASFPTFFRNDAVASMLGSLIQADSARSALLARATPNHPDVVAIEDRIAELEGQLGDIGRNYLRSLNDQIDALDEELDDFRGELEQVPGRQITFLRLSRQVEILGELYKTLQTRLKEAQIQESMNDSSVRVVEDAIEPIEPLSPRPARNLVLAVVLGLVMGSMIAFVREYTDDRLRGTDSLDTLFGLPTIARIPVPAAREHRGVRPLMLAEDAGSVSAESFRSLRTNVGLERRDRGGDTLLVTSPSAAEEKAATAGNFAVTLARAGFRTLLVDADMRRPSQHVPFDLAREPGLSDFLRGDGGAAEVMRATSVDGLFVLPAGRAVGNPAELLGSPETGQLLRELRAGFDAVIIDAPPVLAVTDAAVLAPDVDGVILVVRAEATARHAIALAIRQLRQLNAKVLGGVVTDADAESAFQASYSEYFGGRESASGLGGLLDRIRDAFSGRGRL